jgi:hypothetical protein
MVDIPLSIIPFAHTFNERFNRLLTNILNYKCVGRGAEKEQRRKGVRRTEKSTRSDLGIPRHNLL